MRNTRNYARENARSMRDFVMKYVNTPLSLPFPRRRFSRKTLVDWIKSQAGMTIQRCTTYFTVFILLTQIPVMAETGRQKPWQMNFQEAATPMMAGINDMHNLLLIIIAAIALVVGCLMS